MAEWASILLTSLKVALLILEKQKSKPVEERRASLAELDDAVRKAKEKKDASDLSKWFGGRI